MALGKEKKDKPWREALDSSSGKTYYYNITSGEVTWTKPPEGLIKRKGAKRQRSKNKSSGDQLPSAPEGGSSTNSSRRQNSPQHERLPWQPRDTEHTSTPGHRTSLERKLQVQTSAGKSAAPGSRSPILTQGKVISPVQSQGKSPKLSGYKSRLSPEEAKFGGSRHSQSMGSLAISPDNRMSDQDLNHPLLNAFIKVKRQYGSWNFVPMVHQAGVLSQLVSLLKSGKGQVLVKTLELTAGALGNPDSCSLLAEARAIGPFVSLAQDESQETLPKARNLALRALVEMALHPKTHLAYKPYQGKWEGSIENTASKGWTSLICLLGRTLKLSTKCRKNIVKFVNTARREGVFTVEGGFLASVGLRPSGCAALHSLSTSSQTELHDFAFWWIEGLFSSKNQIATFTRLGGLCSLHALCSLSNRKKALRDAAAEFTLQLMQRSEVVSLALFRSWSGMNLLAPFNAGRPKDCITDAKLKGIESEIPVHSQIVLLRCPSLSKVYRNQVFDLAKFSTTEPVLSALATYLYTQLTPPLPSPLAMVEMVGLARALDLQDLGRALSQNIKEALEDYADLGPSIQEALSKIEQSGSALPAKMREQKCNGEEDFQQTPISPGGENLESQHCKTLDVKPEQRNEQATSASSSAGIEGVGVLHLDTLQPQKESDDDESQKITENGDEPKRPPGIGSLNEAQKDSRQVFIQLMEKSQDFIGPRDLTPLQRNQSFTFPFSPEEEKDVSTGNPPGKCLNGPLKSEAEVNNKENDDQNTPKVFIISRPIILRPMKKDQEKEEQAFSLMYGNSEFVHAGDILISPMSPRHGQEQHPLQETSMLQMIGASPNEATKSAPDSTKKSSPQDSRDSNHGDELKVEHSASQKIGKKISSPSNRSVAVVVPTEDGGISSASAMQQPESQVSETHETPKSSTSHDNKKVFPIEGSDSSPATVSVQESPDSSPAPVDVHKSPGCAAEIHGTPASSTSHDNNHASEIEDSDSPPAAENAQKSFLDDSKIHGTPTSNSSHNDNHVSEIEGSDSPPAAENAQKPFEDDPKEKDHVSSISSEKPKTPKRNSQSLFSYYRQRVGTNDSSKDRVDSPINSQSSQEKFENSFEPVLETSVGENSANDGQSENSTFLSSNDLPPVENSLEGISGNNVKGRAVKSTVVSNDDLSKADTSLEVISGSHVEGRVVNISVISNDDLCKADTSLEGISGGHFEESMEMSSIFSNDLPKAENLSEANSDVKKEDCVENSTLISNGDPAKAECKNAVPEHVSPVENVQFEYPPSPAKVEYPPSPVQDVPCIPGVETESQQNFPGNKALRDRVFGHFKASKKGTLEKLRNSPPPPAHPRKHALAVEINVANTGFSTDEETYDTVESDIDDQNIFLAMDISTIHEESDSDLSKSHSPVSKTKSALKLSFENNESSPFELSKPSPKSDSQAYGEDSTISEDSTQSSDDLLSQQSEGVLHQQERKHQANKSHPVVVQEKSQTSSNCEQEDISEAIANNVSGMHSNLSVDTTKKSPAFQRLDKNLPGFSPLVMPKESEGFKTKGNPQRNRNRPVLNQDDVQSILDSDSKNTSEEHSAKPSPVKTTYFKKMQSEELVSPAPKSTPFPLLSDEKDGGNVPLEISPLHMTPLPDGSQSSLSTPGGRALDEMLKPDVLEKLESIKNLKSFLSSRKQIGTQKGLQYKSPIPRSKSEEIVRFNSPRSISPSLKSKAQFFLKRSLQQHQRSMSASDMDDSGYATFELQGGEADSDLKHFDLMDKDSLLPMPAEIEEEREEPSMSGFYASPLESNNASLDASFDAPLERLNCLVESSNFLELPNNDQEQSPQINRQPVENPKPTSRRLSLIQTMESGRLSISQTMESGSSSPDEEWPDDDWSSNGNFQEQMSSCK